MPLSESLDFFEKFNFIVEIAGIRRAGFTTVSDLSMNFGKTVLREGGRTLPHKKPGLTDAEDITLERGVVMDADFHTWAKQVMDAASGNGITALGYKRTIDIIVIDRDGSERAKYTVYGAFPIKIKAGEWDATSEEAVMEELVLACDYFEASL
jgi:phage tail-like protein